MNKGTTADEILACTRRLIASGGYNGFSYADIADVVGIRKASIHHHFPGKVDLVVEFLKQYRSQTAEGVKQLEHVIPVPIEQLRAYVKYWKDCIGDGSAPICVCALLASEIPILPEEVVSQVRAYFQFLLNWLTSVLERGQQQGDIVISNPANVEAAAFMATVHGAMLSARACGDPGVFGLIMDAQLERLSAHR